MSYGVTQQMIDTYGEIIFKLSLNKQSRRGDAVRELNFEEIEKQRETTGLTDDEIATQIGLLPEQVGVVRVFVERKYHRIDLHRRLFHLGGGKRWKADEYQHPAERLKIREENMALRQALTLVLPMGISLVVCQPTRMPQLPTLKAPLIQSAGTMAF